VSAGAGSVGESDRRRALGHRPPARAAEDGADIGHQRRLPRGGSARHQATGPDHRRPQIQGRTQADGRLPCRHVDAGDVEEQQGRHRRGDDAERR